MNKFIALIIILFVPFASFVFSQSGVWTSVGGSGTTLTRLHFNSAGDTLYTGTIEGYRFYSLYSSQWVIKDMSGYIGRTVGAISTVPGRPARVITGRVNAFFKGYIELNDNFSVQGTIVRNSQGGKFSDIKYCIDHPDTLFACAFSDITPGDLARSTNGGSNWILLSNYLNTTLTEIAINPVNTNIIYVSGDGKITKSTNYGDTWFSSFDGLPSNLGCYCVAINPFNSQVLLTSNDNGIYRSTNAGQNWIQVYNSACRRIAFHPAFQGLVSAITFSPYKLLYSSDSGLNWFDSTGTFPGVNMIDLAISHYDNNVYVASTTSGIYKRLYLITNIEKKNEIIPVEYKLYQNYPNPFNPSTNIEFYLAEKNFVTVKICNIEGKEIQTLVNRIKPAGSHTVRFNSSHLTSGIYFCIFEVNKGIFRDVKKIVLIK